jgi:Bacterial Ig-like domain
MLFLGVALCFSVSVVSAASSSSNNDISTDSVTVQNQAVQASGSIDTSAPTVASSDPVNNAVSVARDKVVTVSFSEPVQGGTLNFELKNSLGTVIPITSSVSGKVLTITPSSLLALGTGYNLILHTGSVTDLAGNPLALKVIHFTTDPPPTVTSIAPTKNIIIVSFSEAVQGGNLCFELKNSLGTVIPITNSISGNVLTITPSTLLVIGTGYNLILYEGSVTDLSGNPLALKVISFTVKPYKTVWITSDNIFTTAADNKRMTDIVALLRSWGVDAKVFGLGPNTHYSVLKASNVLQNALVVNIYGGACAATIYEMGQNYYKALKGTREVYSIWISPPATDIRGLAWLPRAHDDDFSPSSFTGLAHPDQFLINQGYHFLVTSGDILKMAQAILNEAKT